MADIDFGAIASQVTDYIAQGNPSSEESTPASASEATPSSPSAPSPSQAPPTGEEPAKQTATPTAEDLIEIQLPDGSVEKLTRQQIRDGYLRQADYTRKTQELAEARKAVEPIAQAYQRMQSEYQQVGQLLNNPELLTQYALQTFGPQYAQAIQQMMAAQNQQFLPQGVQQDDIINAEQAAYIAEQRAAAYVQQLQAKMAELEQRLESKAKDLTEQGIQNYQDLQQVAKHNETITSHLNGLFEKHPVLTAVPEMEEALRFRVWQRKPQTEAEALQYFTEEATRQASKLEEKFTELQKVAVAQKAKLETHGTVPPGGVGIQPEPKSFKKKDGSIDWKSLSSSAQSYLDSSRK